MYDKDMLVDILHQTLDAVKRLIKRFEPVEPVYFLNERGSVWIHTKAGIHTLTGYSAHADQNMLVNWVSSMPEPPGEIRLVHGEAKARKAIFKNRN